MNIPEARQYVISPQQTRGPQLHPIKALHRHDGYITFMVKDNDDGSLLTRRFAIRADALDTWFPEFTADLVRNSFVSINASYTLADRSMEAYGRPLHETASLRYLCACYCDIDYYSRGLNSRQVKAEIERMWEAGELPEASMVVDSGRGMWLLWLLYDPLNPNRAHYGGWNDNPNDHLLLYTRINKGLHTRLDHIGADRISDGVRSIRVPGSFRNDTEEFVRWRIHGDSDRVISYTLKELAEAVGLKLTRRPTSERKALCATTVGKGNQSNGWRKTNQNRLAAFATIRDQRAGGFSGGCRHKAAFLYAMALRWAEEGSDWREARAALVEMGRGCDPPLSIRECIEAWRQGYRTKNPKLQYQTMADWLDVSPAEAEIVSQVLYGRTQAGDRRFFPAARRYGQVEPITNAAGDVPRRAKKIMRHDAERAIIAKLGYVPTVRKMQQLLLDMSVEVSVGTVQVDYKSIGIASVHAEIARPIEEIGVPFPDFDDLPHSSPSVIGGEERNEFRDTTSLYAFETEQGRRPRA